MLGQRIKFFKKIIPSQPTFYCSVGCDFFLPNDSPHFNWVFELMKEIAGFFLENLFKEQCLSFCEILSDHITYLITTTSEPRRCNPDLRNVKVEKIHGSAKIDYIATRIFFAA
jgi:hypothetical protein